MTSSGLRLRRRANAIGIGVALIAMVLAGCSDMDQADPVRITNLTSGPLELTLHYTLSSGADSPGTIETIEAGATYLFRGGFFESCVTGTFLALQDGQTVATIEKPCEGSRWEITQAGASQTS